jgi:DNA-binding transcriptional LysR family regulator
LNIAIGGQPSDRCAGADPGHPALRSHRLRAEAFGRGGLLLRNIRAALSGYGDVVTALDALKGLTRGRIKVATVESISVGLLPDLLTAFWQKLPDIEISVTVTGAEAVTRQVQEGHADIGFTFNPRGMEA